MSYQVTLNYGFCNTGRLPIKLQQFVRNCVSFLYKNGLLFFLMRGETEGLSARYIGIHFWVFFPFYLHPNHYL